MADISPERAKELVALDIAQVAPATGASLPQCRAVAAAPASRGQPLAMATCVLFGAGRA